MPKNYFLRDRPVPPQDQATGYYYVVSDLKWSMKQVEDDLNDYTHNFRPPLQVRKAARFTITLFNERANKAIGAYVEWIPGQYCVMCAEWNITFPYSRLRQWCVEIAGMKLIQGEFNN